MFYVSLLPKVGVVCNPLPLDLASGASVITPSGVMILIQTINVASGAADNVADRGEMRLVCPNCDAQYEIGPEAIPESGRDVQCSNCGHTWFQAHHDALGGNDHQGAAAWDEDASSPAVTEAIRPDDQENARDPIQGDISAQADASDDDAAIAPHEAAAGADGPDDESAAAPPLAGLPPRRPLNEGVSDILREEAAREQHARASERPTALETQPELGIDVSAGPGEAVAATVARERVARLRGNNPEPVPEVEPGKRRDLLPDIEEINSTLRSASDREGDEDAASDSDQQRQTSRRRGFRLGFGVVTILAALMLLAYQKAPVLIARMPQSQPYVVAYVQWVNDKRGYLDQWARNAAEKLSSSSGAGQ